MESWMKDKMMGVRPPYPRHHTQSFIVQHGIPCPLIFSRDVHLVHHLASSASSEHAYISKSNLGVI